MKYTHHYQIKWHDTDANREVRPSRILMYMQETANHQLEDSGLPLDVLRDREGLAFILSKISVCIYQPLFAYDEIDVMTWVSEGKGFSFLRYFCIMRGETVIAEAHSVWALVNIADRRLLRAEEFSVPAPVDTPLELDLPRRFRFPQDATEAGERTIRYADIDYNGHMNNTNYPDMLCDFTPEILARRVSAFTLSYLHEATYAHTLKILRADVEDGHLFRTVDTASGNVCLDAYVRLENR